MIGAAHAIGRHLSFARAIDTISLRRPAAGPFYNIWGRASLAPYESRNDGFPPPRNDR